MVWPSPAIEIPNPLANQMSLQQTANFPVVVDNENMQAAFHLCVPSNYAGIFSGAI
jgi:hypothetical protein